MENRRLPSIIVTCVEDAPCTVYFEPLGSEYELHRGDYLRIESESLLSGELEIAYSANAVLLVLPDVLTTIVTNKAGQRVRL